MPTATMTSKGQITIPVEVRDDLGLDPGTRVSFVKVAPGVYELVPETVSIRSLRGSLAASSSPASIDDLNDAIAAAAAAAGAEQH